MTINGTEGVGEPRLTDAKPSSSGYITQTKKHTTALIPEDYREVSKELSKAIRRVRELVAAKNELEIQAILTGVILPSPAEITDPEL